MAVRHQSDDPIRFEELWEHREHVRAVCLGIVKDPVVVDDLVQDTYVRALTTSHPPDRRGPIAAWLTVVARHRALDKVRADRCVGDGTTMVERAVTTGEGPVEQVLRAERRDRVRRALTELDDRDRGLLVQHVVHGVPVTELAKREQATEASIRSTLWRVRQKFRVAIERGGPLTVAPADRLAGPLRRHRVVWNRLESGGASLLAGIGWQLVEAAVTAAAVAVMLLTSSPHSSRVPMPPPGADAVGPSATGVVLPVPAKPLDVRANANIGIADSGAGELRPTVGARVGVGTDIGGWRQKVGFDGRSDDKVTDIDVTVDVDNPLVDLPVHDLTLTWTCGPPEKNRVELPAGYWIDGCPPFGDVVRLVDGVDSP
jgi:RNA polymerase sigma factor (sigma-70 family)